MCHMNIKNALNIDVRTCVSRKYMNPISLYIYLTFSGARAVVVIAVGNEHGDTSSNPGRY